VKNKFLKMDERNVRIVKQVQSVMHTLTSLVLVVIFFYRHNVMEQAFAEICDIGLLMILNGLFFCGALLYFGGIPFDRFKIKFIITGYIVFVLLVFVFKCFAQFIQHEQSFSIKAVLAAMPVIMIICGIVASIFILFAYLGKRKTDKELE
jgi:hypothetical protein